MIERTQGYKVGDLFCATIEEAQSAEVMTLVVKHNESKVTDSVLPPEAVSEFVVNYRTELIDILTTTAKSKVRARSIHGGKKPRKAKTPTPEALENGK